MTEPKRSVGGDDGQSMVWPILPAEVEHPITEPKRPEQNVKRYYNWPNSMSEAPTGDTLDQRGTMFVRATDYDAAEQRVAELEVEVERLKAMLDGDPNQTATSEQRRAWRASAVRYADKLEAELAKVREDFIRCVESRRNVGKRCCELEVERDAERALMQRMRDMLKRLQFCYLPIRTLRYTDVGELLAEYNRLLPQQQAPGDEPLGKEAPR